MFMVKSICRKSGVEIYPGFGQGDLMILTEKYQELLPMTWEF